MRSLSVAFVLVLSSILLACGGSQPPEPEYAEEDGNAAIVTDATPEEVAAMGNASTTVTNDPPAPSGAGPVVRIETSMGVIRIRLDQEHAPASVANFLQYVRDGFYDGTIFHRVIDDFMIQGGGFTPGMVRKQTRPPIGLEISPALRHVDGAVAMARTSDRNSATAQFYICDGPQPRLDDQYAVFGQTIEGMDVVRAIASTPTGPGDVPRADVVMVSVRAE